MTSFLRGSLFDRLIDQEPTTPAVSTSIKTLTLEELKDSIYNELLWLLNTTCSFPEKDLISAQRTTLDYGVQDFSNFFPDSSENRIRLSNMIKRTITSYESRLHNLNVEVKEMDQKNDRFTLSLLIDAELITEQITEPISFIMSID